MSGETSTPIVEVRDLAKNFGGVRAVSGLDLSIYPGELHCIIGPNGAGKSTFFKLLMGIQRPSAGTVLYRGRNVTRLKPFERARLGMAIKFQAMEVYQELTVFQNLFIPLRRHHRPPQIPKQAALLLEQLHLAGTEQDMVSNLSHGQQQWLAIGMSMAVRPDLLLLDEPTAGMSPEETSETARIVKDLNADGITIVVIEHDMAFIRNLDSRTSVLHYGKLFAQGSFGEIERNEDVHRIYLGAV
jgi:branched-chain amino acid transport system ATP-binding protein